jgi:hypothetical protein
MWPSLIAWMIASMSVKPVRIIRTVVGWRRCTSVTNSTPLMSGMRWSVSTTANGPFESSRSSARRGSVEVWTS